MLVNNEEDALRTTKILKQPFSFEGENFTGMFFLRTSDKKLILKLYFIMAKLRRKSLVNRR